MEQETLRKMMTDKGVKKDIKVAGTASLLYASRRQAPAKVNVWAVKNAVPVAALPATDTGDVVSRLREVFTQFIPAKNILEVGIGNPNLVVHCAAAVLNAGRIEDTKGNFMFDWEGMTESVCRVIGKVDEERMAVAKGLGLELMSTLDFLELAYPSEKRELGLHDFLTHSRVHGGRGSDAPKDLHHRYVSEDVPYGMVPVSAFGKLMNVSTPTIDSVIHLASVMNETDYFKEEPAKKWAYLGSQPRRYYDWLKR